MADGTVTITLAGDGSRKCGSCTLCCRLLPIKGFKVANKACQHQCSKGCRIYEKRPMDCRFWSCRWLTGEGTESMPRPDRCGYVIDAIPDRIWMVPDDAPDKPREVMVVQIWVGQDRTIWRRRPELIDYIEAMGRQGIATLVRYDETNATPVIPTAMGGWYEFPEQACGGRPRAMMEALS